MDINKQIYTFYKPYLSEICQTIEMGKTAIVVGINSMGKTLLIEQLLSDRFRTEFLVGQTVRFVYLEFKDKNPPASRQLYKYWLTQTAEAVGYQLPADEAYNDYSFYFYLSEMAKQLSGDEKLVFVVLDAQNILNQGEAFFKSLVYLHRFTYGKVSYLLFSEPHILDSKSIWVQRFIQDFTNHKFTFLKLFDRETVLADIKREEGFLSYTLPKSAYPLIVMHSGGLHGAIGALCYFFKKYPNIQDIRTMRKIVDEDRMCRYWLTDIFDSIPKESLRVLKNAVEGQESFKRHEHTIFGKWLVDLSFLKKDGTFRHPLMLQSLLEYSPGRSDDKKSQLRLAGAVFYASGQRVKLTKKEKAVLTVLYKSKGKLVSYDRISSHLWSDDPDKFSLWAVAQVIRRLRKKLASYFINPHTIRIVRGEGYVFQ